jgi:hypothetical protein
MVNLIAAFSEFAQLVFLRSNERDRVVKRPVKYLTDVRESSGASRLNNVTDYDAIPKVYSAHVLANVLGILSAQVDPYLLHDTPGVWVDGVGQQTGAVRLIPIAGMVSEKGLCHLTASRIAGTQEENPSFAHRQHPLQAILASVSAM